MIHRRGNVASSIKLLLAVGVVTWAGCSSRNEDMASESRASDAAVANGSSMAMDAVPTSDGMGMVQDGAETYTAGGAATQKRDALIQAHLSRADRFISQGRLPEAHEQALAALNLDERNADAQRKFKEVQALMGSSTQDSTTEYIDFKRSIREKQVAEVNGLFVGAQNAYARNDLADAKQDLDLAQLTMRYDAYQTDFGALPQDVEALQAEVARSLEQRSAAIEEEEFQSAYEALKADEERERRRQAEQVRNLMMEAAEAFNRQDFETSEDLARRVLSRRPNYRKAKELVEISIKARQSAWRKSFYEARRNNLQKWMQDVREAQIPYTDLVAFPSREFWDDITLRRRAREAAVAAIEDSAQVQALKNRLENTDVNWDFSEMTLAEAVQHIRDVENVNIIFSKDALEELGDEPAEVKFTNLNFGSALRTMLEGRTLTYTYKYDMIYVVKTDAATGQAIPKIYEVRDLTLQLPNFKPPQLQLRPGPAGETAMAAVFGEELDPTPQNEPEQLVDLIRDTIEPSSWEIEDRVLEISANQLVVVTTPEIHKQIDRFLDDLRRFMKVIVHVETRFISIRDGFLQDIGVDIRGLGGANPGTLALLDDVNNGPIDNASAGLDNNGPGSPAADSLSPSSGFFFNDPSTRTNLRGRTENIFTRVLGGFLTNTGGASLGFTFLDDIELGVLFRAVEKSTFATTLTAPRLTIYNNQRANLTIVNQVTYVKDYDVEVAQTAFIADPLVDIIQDGLVLDVRPTVSHDRKYVTLEVRPTVASLNRPITTFVTSLAGLTTPVIIELPELTYREAATTVRVPDNGWVVLGGLKDVSTVDRRSETPILSQIPILGFFFSRKGRSNEISDLIIALHVKIVDLAEEEAKLTR